jgi:transposase
MGKRIYREAGSSSELHDDITQELARLRKENSILRQEREILKRAATFFAKEGSR